MTAVDRHLHVVDLGLVAELVDAKLGEIGVVDRHADRRAQGGDAAFDDVPRQACRA